MDGEIKVCERTKYLVLVPLSLLGLGALLREPYVSLTGVLLLSLFLYARYEISNIDVDIESHTFNGNKMVGEPFEIEHKIRSDKRAPVKVVSDFDESFEMVKEPDGDKQPGSTFSSRIIPNKRGYQNIGKFQVRVKDPFGFYAKTEEHNIDLELIIHPSREDIQKAKNFTDRIEMLARTVHFTVQSQEFETVREYHPGDSAKDIHWESLSKFQKLMSKKYEQREPVDVYVFLDCSLPMRRKLPDGTSKLEHAIHVSLQMLKNFQLLGHNIGMIAYDHKNVLFEEGTRGEKTLFKRLYEKVNDLPDPVDNLGKTFDRYDPEVFKSADEDRFSKKMKTFDPDPLSTEILPAMTQLQKTRGEKNLVIMISDIEKSPRATAESIDRLREEHNLVWLIVPFGPWYDVQKVDEQVLEKTYQEYERLEEILDYLRELDTKIFELYPDKDGLMILEERLEEK